MRKSILLTAIFLISSGNAFAEDATVKGLICDNATGGQKSKMKVEISVKAKTAILVLRDSSSLTPSGFLKVPAKSIASILEQNLGAMNKVALEDKSQNATIEFKVDGYTFDQKPRLKITVSSATKNLVVTSCQVEIDRPYRMY